jgi:energy-coupling factor transport system substrate-specific component
MSETAEIHNPPQGDAPIGANSPSYDSQVLHEMAIALAQIINTKDECTNGHSLRVAEYTRLLAIELGYDDETVNHFFYAALLHDIGKICIPDYILTKDTNLTESERNEMREHTLKGYRILKTVESMPELADAAKYHHERPDGKGYPNHLKAGEIPRVAQIIAVADCFDAMYSNRPYRSHMNFEKAVSIIREVSGTQLTPDVVDAFLRLVEKGEFRDPDDHGGGTTETIDNIRK